MAKRADAGVLSGASSAPRSSAMHSPSEAFGSLRRLGLRRLLPQSGTTEDSRGGRPGRSKIWEAMRDAALATPKIY